MPSNRVTKVYGDGRSMEHGQTGSICHEYYSSFADLKNEISLYSGQKD
jgi:hypothetical protein